MLKILLYSNVKLFGVFIVIPCPCVFGISYVLSSTFLSLQKILDLIIVSSIKTPADSFRLAEISLNNP